MGTGRGGVQDWVDRIRERDMPVFGRTVQEVRSVTEDEMASATRLSRAILQDAALTTKVLKLSNSVTFNLARQAINTISRAVVVLGFDLVGDIVLSIQLIDALLAGGLRGRVAAEMARSFHAAVQARTAALARGSRQSEEVFIAALLGHVGEMAFWCFGGREADALDAALREQPDERPEDLQMDILGFRLASLSAALAREWRLGPLVLAAAQPPVAPDGDERAVIEGYHLARAVEEGWETPAARAALATFADFVGQPLKEISAELAGNAVEAARVAAQFGAAEAASLIPLPKGELVDLTAEIKAESLPIEPDPLLQLRILRDLSALLAARPGLNEVLQLVLEGIHRGLGMKRAVFALQSADRGRLVGKLALGIGAEVLAAAFVFPLDQRPGEIINELFRQGLPFRLQGEAPEGIRLDRLEAVTGRRDGLLAPIIANGRVIGLFYADRSAGAEPNDEIWQGFLHFAQQASLSVEHVAGLRRT